jgi:hypothetical protein
MNGTSQHSGSHRNTNGRITEGVATMGPEERMRMELERFVNAGLEEGWTGWPLKVDSCISKRFSGEWSPASVQSWLGESNALAVPDRLAVMFGSLLSLC